MSSQTNNIQNSPDAGFILGGALALNRSFDARAESHRVYLAQIEAEWQEVFTASSEWLEGRLPFIQSGESFKGMTPAERTLHTEELLTTLRSQREWVGNFEQETSNPAATRLVAVLDKMISALEQQPKTTRISSLFMNRSDLRSMLGPRSSRRTTAKNWGPFPPAQNTE
ncbi:hypothetical protein IAD21_02419 [Abditibacteriota bacterium]|nr:hypothetical protein IAD21_02419 [Abditibacteriota bacterium]